MLSILHTLTGAHRRNAIQNRVYMNGATADPADKTISTPNTNKIRIIGASQYFLRTRIKVHNSTSNDTEQSSELVFHRVGGHRGIFTRDPITRLLALWIADIQDILAKHAQQQASWDYHRYKNKA